MSLPLITLVPLPVWRNETTVQFGLQGTTRLDNPTKLQLTLIAALTAGTTSAELERIAHTTGDEAVLGDLLESLHEIIEVRVRPERFAVISQGTATAMAAKLAALLPTPGVVESDIADSDVVWVVADYVLVPRTCAELMSTDTPH